MYAYKISTNCKNLTQVYIRMCIPQWRRLACSICKSFVQLDLVLNSEDGGDLSDFITNGEWYLIGKSFAIILNLIFDPYKEF